jgi:hypothetical protein
MEVSFWLKQHHPTLPPPDACTAIAAAFDRDLQGIRQAAGYR